MSLSSPKMFPNGFMKSLVNDGKNYDETTEPVVDPRSLIPGDAIDDSAGTGVASDGQATNLTDNDIRAQLTFDPADSDTDELLEMEMALTNRDTYDFGFLGLHNIRDAFPAAVNQQVDFLRHTAADIANATAIVPNSMVSGFLGQGLSFQRYNGVDSVTASADDPNFDFGNGDGSIEVWIRIPDVSVTTIWYSRRVDDTNEVVFFFDGSTLFCTLEDGGTKHRGGATWAPNANQWYHIVYTFVNGVSNALYVDGASQTLDQANTITGADFELTAELNVGEHNAAFYSFDRRNLIQYNRALSSSEVLDHFENPELYPLVADQDGSQTDLGSNPSFTTDLTDWVDGGNHTLTRDVGTFLTAPASGKIVASGAGSEATNFVAYQSVSRTVGKRYGIVVWARTDTGTNTLNLARLNNTGTEASWSITTTWTAFFFESENVAGANDIRLFLTNSGTAFIDDVVPNQTGAVAVYLPDGINPDDSKWYDSSTNDLDGTNTAVIHMQAPTGTDYGFTLALFTEASDAFWFARINEDVLTAAENVRLGQWMMGKSFTPTFNPDTGWTEEIGADGVVLSRTHGGRFIGNRRHGTKLRWTFKWSWLPESDKLLFNAYYATVGGKLYPHLFSPDSDNIEPRYHMVRLLSGNPFTGMGADALGLTMILEED